MTDKDTLINEILALTEGLRTATDTLVTIENQTGTDIFIKHFKNESQEECFIINKFLGFDTLSIEGGYVVDNANSTTFEIGFEEPLFDRCCVDTTLHNERPSLRTKANISREIRERLEQIVKIGTIRLNMEDHTGENIYVQSGKASTGQYIFVLASHGAVEDPEFLAEWNKGGGFHRMKDNKVTYNISIRV